MNDNQPTYPNNTAYRQPPAKKHHWWKIIWPIATIGLVMLLMANSRTLLDFYYLKTFQPGQGMQKLIDRIDLTNQGKRILYSAQPALIGDSTFNDKCRGSETSSNIIGCFVDNRIYVFDVKNQELDGIREVTLAHEMLHAAYVRLSNNEKSQVNKWVEEAFTKCSTEDLKARFSEYYDKYEPADRDNELHSILGTECKDLPSGLENYYRRFFNNRAGVVAMSAAYIGQFNELTTQINTLVKTLDDLATSINTQTTEYNDAAEELTREIADFNTRADNGAFASQAAFDAERAALMTEVGRLETMRQQIEADTNTYNEKKAQYDKLSLNLQSLNNSINSQLAPAPSV
ncbi:hypothetical protein FWF48_01350 [Candidatus Saccharibacteria bacterium]|nr:hypothetical protein [Candidatus Saccharibacteria bacterium]